MNPERKTEINGNLIEEFYWNGKLLTYVNNQLAEGSYDNIVKTMTESKVTFSIDKFIKEFNNLGSGVCEIKLTEHKLIEENDEFIRFDVFLKENIMLRTGMLTPTDDYYFIVKKLGQKYFKSEANFNNTGSTFWFWIKLIKTGGKDE